MAVNQYDTKLNQNEINLASDIYCFLLKERCQKHYSAKERRRFDIAADTIEKVYKVKYPDNVAVKQMNSLEDTFATGKQVSIRNKETAEHYKQKGNSYMDRGQFDLAEVEYTRATEIDPTNPVYFCNRAASKIRQGLCADAVADCKRALELDKNYAKAYCWLGLSYVLMGHPAKALRCYHKALRLEPNNPVCITNIDLISKKLHLRVFTVLEPLYWLSHRLRHIATYLTQNYRRFRKKDREHSSDIKSTENTKDKSSQIQKYELCEID